MSRAIPSAPQEHKQKAAPQLFIPRSAGILTLTAALAVAIGVGGTGCTESTAADPGTVSPPVTVSAAWAKAAEAGQATSVFAEITNHTDVRLNVTKATATDAASAQLHTTSVDASGSSQMSEVTRLPIPAGATLHLEPGGDHIMLMGLTRTIEPGDSIRVKIALSDGTSASFTALVKSYSGAQEDYGMSPSPSAPSSPAASPAASSSPSK